VCCVPAEPCDHTTSHCIMSMSSIHVKNMPFPSTAHVLGDRKGWHGSVECVRAWGKGLTTLLKPRSQRGWLGQLNLGMMGCDSHGTGV